jgi:phosphoglycolate phosphatase
MSKLDQLTSLKAVFFDLDGTLVDSAIDIYHAINAALTELGKPLVSESQVRLWVGRGAPQLVWCVLKQQQTEVSPEQQNQLLHVFLKHYEKNVCVDSKIYEGVLPFIEACQQKKLLMACITNKPYQPAYDLLQALNLLSPFQLILGGDSLTHRKPHPESLLHALHYFNLKPHEALMIGDSRNDVEAAHAAGMPCFALTYGYNHGESVALCQPDLVLDSLLQLL